MGTTTMMGMDMDTGMAMDMAVETATTAGGGLR